MAVATKRIRERVAQINSAWAQGASHAVFNGISQSEFQTRVQTGIAIDQRIVDAEAQLIMMKDERDGIYTGLNSDSVKVRDGVEGHPDFGTDHPIIEAMGFVRTSERKSGLTRKNKSTGT